MSILLLLEHRQVGSKAFLNLPEAEAGMSDTAPMMRATRTSGQHLIPQAVPSLTFALLRGWTSCSQQLQVDLTTPRAHEEAEETDQPGESALPGTRLANS